MRGNFYFYSQKVPDVLARKVCEQYADDLKSKRSILPKMLVENIRQQLKEYSCVRPHCFCPQEYHPVACIRINEYESCERLSHNILSQITQRDNIPKLTEDYSRISANIRIRLKQFSTELSQLKIKLEASSRSRSITVEEIERRQRQIESLQSKFQQLETRFKSVSPTDRESLLTPSASQLWEDDDDDPPIFNKSNYTVQDLRQQQIQILEDQNKGLEALSQTISRQKNLASRLGMEVEQQNEIVDNIADDMERVDTRVITETQNIQSISRQDSTWGYWIIIVTLFVLICIVELV